MKKHKIIVIFALLVSGNSLFCMQESTKLIPLALSVKKASWTRYNAPHAFDEYAKNIATRNEGETVITKDGVTQRIINSPGYGCALSPDGSILAIPQREFNIDMISFWDLQAMKEIAITDGSPIMQIAVSNASSSLVAFVEKENSNTIKFADFLGNQRLPNIQIQTGSFGKIALNPDGAFLATIFTPYERQLNNPPNFVIVLNLNNHAQLTTIGSPNKHIVNVAFGEKLILELENSNGERAIKTMALFDAGLLNQQQIDLLKFIHSKLDAKRVEGEKAAINLTSQQQQCFDSLPENYRKIILSEAIFNISDFL